MARIGIASSWLAPDHVRPTFVGVGGQERLAGTAYAHGYL